MKQLFKKIGTLAMVATLGSFSVPLAAGAKTKSVSGLPRIITSHTWHRKTDGVQGGYNDRAKITKHNIHLHSKAIGTKNWKLTSIRKSSAKVYYAKLHFTKKVVKPVKIKIVNSKKFDIIQKHISRLPGNYTGNEGYGAIIFQR